MMEQPSNNVINNYKGVMLCSRPNDSPSAPIEKPFCGRVYNHQQLGLVPVKSNQSPKRVHKKTVAPVLSKHKQWLEKFKEKQNRNKEQRDKREKEEQERLRKVKQIAENDRERAKKMKDQYRQTATQVLNILDDDAAPSRPGELTAANLRKLDELNEQKQKQAQQPPKQQQKRDKATEQLFKKAKKLKRPQWAMTEQMKQKQQQEQVDQLLNFFNKQVIVNEFAEDQQVKSILKNLKNKIEEIKQKEDWRQREAQRIKQRQQRKKDRQNNSDDDDKVTHGSGASEARSIMSEKAQKNIQDLKKKKEEKQWDSYTATSKQSFANIDEKIAKNLADEVLRNYPHLRGVHSNTSIRRLLQSEAAKAINQPINRPIITTVIRQPKPMDTNNLPYLHRNPAI